MNNNVKLKRESGKDERSVAAFVAAEAEKERPLLSWAEPDASYARKGKPGRIGDFVPLVAGCPDWPKDLPLVEARLFWATSALHVIADDKGCRWARLWESDAGEEKDRRSEKDVLTLQLQDAERFGMTTHGWPNLPLTAIEYRSGGRLVGWRLITRGKEQTA